MDSPKSSILIEWCTILSRIASAIVFSPITSCQSHTGTWEVMMVLVVRAYPRLCPSVRMRGGIEGMYAEVIKDEKVGTLDPFQFGKNRAFCLCGLQLTHQGVLCWRIARASLSGMPGSPERLLCSFCLCLRLLMMKMSRGSVTKVISESRISRFRSRPRSRE